MTPSSLRRLRALRSARALLVLSLALVLGSCDDSSSSSGTPPVGTIEHVFVIVLENKGYDETFGAGSVATYLNGTLVPQGQLLREYYGIGHLSLTNYIAMVSGQAPNPSTQADCTTYTDFVESAPVDADGQAVGAGCVYPASIETIANQLEARGYTWRAYQEDMGNTPGEPTTCRHPAIGQKDPTVSARLGDEYTTRHNPFVYFHSVIDTPSCAANDVPLTALEADLASAATTPNYVFITPNLCNDGHDGPCIGGAPGGLVSADAFLSTWVPKILASPAYQDGGLLVITFDEAEFGGSSADSADCCNEPTGPNTATPGIVGPGGGRTGALLISPHVAPGTTNDTPYNHYSFLRTVEDLFGLPYLGYAGQKGLRSFGRDVFY